MDYCRFQLLIMLCETFYTKSLQFPCAAKNPLNQAKLLEKLYLLHKTTMTNSSRFDKYGCTTVLDAQVWNCFENYLILFLAEGAVTISSLPAVVWRE